METLHRRNSAVSIEKHLEDSFGEQWNRFSKEQKAAEFDSFVHLLQNIGVGFYGRNRFCEN